MSKKKPNGVQLLIRAVVKDPDGKVLSDTGQKPSKSFVIQFLEFIADLFYSTTDKLATAVDGTEDFIYSATTALSMAFRANASINISSYGIVIGTGDTAETNIDYKLETQLTEGVGAGNITHNVMVIGTTAVVGANVDLEIKRAFTNNTGSTITVKEAGIYTFGYWTGPFTTFFGYHCIIRDVLALSIDVSDKCSLTVYYTFRTTV